MDWRLACLVCMSFALVVSLSMCAFFLYEYTQLYQPRTSPDGFDRMSLAEAVDAEFDFAATSRMRKGFFVFDPDETRLAKVMSASQEFNLFFCAALERLSCSVNPHEVQQLLIFMAAVGYKIHRACHERGGLEAALESHRRDPVEGK